MLNVKPRCPDCNRAFRAIEALHFAITFHKRTCQGCGAKFNLKITPLKSNPSATLHVHTAELFRMT